MSTPSALMRLGLPAQQAKRLGLDAGVSSSTLSGGAAFASAQAIGQFALYVRANPQSGANIYQMPNNAEVGTEYLIYNIGGVTGGVTGQVYPPTGGTFNVNLGATATGTFIATGKGVFIVAVTATTFDVFLSA